MFVDPEGQSPNKVEDIIAATGSRVEIDP